MNKYLKLITVVLGCTVSILILGFIIGKFINIIYPYNHEGVAKEYNLFNYTLDQLLSPIYRLFPILFLPFYLLLLIVFWFIAKAYNFGMVGKLLIMLPLYFLYGLLIYGGQFWHLSNLLNGNYGILEWIASEHKDLHYSVASLLSAIMFILIINMSKSKELSSNFHEVHP